MVVSEYCMLYSYEENGQEKEDVMPIRAYSLPQAMQVAQLLCSQNGYRFLNMELTIRNAV